MHRHAVYSLIASYIYQYLINSAGLVEFGNAISAGLTVLVVYMGPVKGLR